MPFLCASLNGFSNLTPSLKKKAHPRWELLFVRLSSGINSLQNPDKVNSPPQNDTLLPSAAITSVPSMKASASPAFTPIASRLNLLLGLSNDTAFADVFVCSFAFSPLRYFCVIPQLSSLPVGSSFSSAVTLSTLAGITSSARLICALFQYINIERYASCICRTASTLICGRHKQIDIAKTVCCNCCMRRRHAEI